METRELQQARALDSSLLARRQQEKRPPDFKTMDMVELDKEIPGLIDAMTGDADDIRICEHCGQEVRRLEFDDPFKRPGFKFRPMPICPCVADASEKRAAWEAKLERKRRLQRTYAKSIIAPAIVDARFNNFAIREGTKIAHDRAVEFCKGFENRKTGLLMFGTVGNGKSHLARAIEYYLDAQGWATLFLDWPQLVELAKATFNNKSNVSVADYVRAALDADLLVLDEIGAGPLTSFEFKELLFPIVNGRSGKPTVYTSNLDPDRLGDWFAKDKESRPLDADGRLIDRILGGCDIVINRGSSKRREDAKRRIEG